MRHIGADTYLPALPARRRSCAGGGVSCERSSGGRHSAGRGIVADWPCTGQPGPESAVGKARGRVDRLAAAGRPGRDGRECGGAGTGGLRSRGPSLQHGTGRRDLPPRQRPHTPLAISRYSSPRRRRYGTPGRCRRSDVTDPDLVRATTKDWPKPATTNQPDHRSEGRCPGVVRRHRRKRAAPCDADSFDRCRSSDPSTSGDFRKVAY